jgi:putative protease
VPLDVEVVAAVGQPLAIVARTAGGVSVQVESAEPLAAAVKHPLTAETLRQQLGRLGGTAYQLCGCQVEMHGEPMAPLSVLGQLRHEIVRLLDEATSQPAPRRVATESVLPALRRSVVEASAGEAATSETRPMLHVLCRSLDQLRSVLDTPMRSMMVDFQDIRQYADAVEMTHERGARILLATPRIQKPDEMGILRVMSRHGADGILVRNLAALAYFAEQGQAVVADFSLNATNELSVDELHRRGAMRVTASYDSNRDQLMELVGAVPPSWLEVVVHQHMPMFHMEHCVFCSVLSPGTNKHNCGRPCDVHQVRLRDRMGMEHPLVADVGCRNTLFNATPQSAAEAVPALVRHGVRHFRIELVSDAPADEIGHTIELYRRLLDGTLSGREVWTALRAANRVGVTRGTLEERRNPLAIL